MKVLIGNLVKTDNGDYPCASREEAEALFMSLKDPAEPKPAGTDPAPPERAAVPGRR